MFIRFMIFAIHMLCWACSLTASSFKWEVSAVCIFQNEDRFLKEWIEFHRLVGVEHFYMYNNNSTDNYKQALKPYVDAGIVELCDWNYSPNGNVGWNSIQCNAYMDAIVKSQNKTRWLAILDTDEFLFPIQVNNLQAFLKDYRKYSGVGVNWQMFGTSHVQHVPADKLMIELLLLQSPVQYGPNIHIKSIVQPLMVAGCGNPHHVDYQPGGIQVNANKVPFTGPFAPCIAIDKIRINHYWLRDDDFLYTVKVPRRLSWGDHDDLIRINNEELNVLKNDAILKYVPKLRKLMFKKT